MSAENRPLVSILVRSMDRATLGRALDSAAAQTWRPLEIVVVAACGALHRDLPADWQGVPLRLVRSARRLPRADAANAALDAARGDWLNLLDDDDELLPNHVETLLSASRDPAVRLLYSSARVVDAEGRVVALSGKAGTHMQLFFQNRCQPVAALFQRSLVAEGARFDPAFDVLEDQDFFVACAVRTAFQWVPQDTCIWYAHAGDSGCGYGANADDARRQRYLDLLRVKWRETFERWREEPESLIFLGQQHLKQGDLGVALDCLERALALAPADLNALNLCAMANFHAGRRARALALLETADRLLPNHPFIRGNLALVRGGDGARAQGPGPVAQ
jgi:glycosyltransferase involved in cell wall biosynthesis